MGVKLDNLKQSMRESTGPLTALPRRQTPLAILQYNYPQNVLVQTQGEMTSNITDQHKPAHPNETKALQSSGVRSTSLRELDETGTFAATFLSLIASGEGCWLNRDVRKAWVRS